MWIPIARKDDLVSGQAKVCEAEGKRIAVYNVDGRFYATDNTCAHQGGPLGEGVLDGATITCPWHAWQYDVKSGESVFDPGVSVACFPTRVDGEDVLVEI